MLKKTLTLSAMVATAFLATGCTYKYSAGTSTVDITKTDMSKVEKMKSGEACVSRFLVFPTGLDATAKTAAQNAGISKIEYQEVNHTDALLFGSSCVKVYGH
jgi:hypothetical protein